jgi:lipopolysaccharide transport system permease protein
MVPITVLYKNRSLVWELVKRTIATRYRGSLLGFAWALLLPLVMLGVYTLVFGYIFEARWGVAVKNKLSFSVILFSGLILFNFFSECLLSAPTLIINHSSYVKKVVFPLEILIWVSIFSSGFTFIASLLVLILFQLAAGMELHATILLFPLVVIPLALITAGLSWFVASLGVYLRDLNHIVGIAVTLFLFLSPIFYPISAVPESVQTILLLNPLTKAIEAFRDLIIWGRLPSLMTVVIYYLGSFLIAMLGFHWFMKTKKGFADVL